MHHSRAKLTPFGRLLLVQRVMGEGWSPAQAAAAAGVSRATVYKWLRRYREEGVQGLEDHSSRPQRCPRATPQAQVLTILEARLRLKVGPHRLAPALGIPRSTIYTILRRYGFSRLADTDRASGVTIRYVRERPGELLHLDIKKLGRIPDGGGHRALGREDGMRMRRQGKRAMGYDYLHVAVDDASRVAFVEVLPDQRGRSAARFLLDAAAFFAEHGVRIERVLTDRAWAYTDSKPFSEAMASIGAKHKVTRPYRPQTNGKAERFIRTLVEEWAYSRLYGSNQERLDALSAYLEFYNHRRPHTALGGSSPMTVLVNNVSGNYI